MAKASGLHSQDRSGNLGRVAICASITDLPVIAKAKCVIGSAEPLEESLSQRESHGSRRYQKRDPIHRVEDAVKPLMSRNLVRLSTEALRSLLLTKGI
jgi:hypothetical protein